MILVGQYDSPFVRRVAVTLNHYQMGFERRVLSVFTDFEAVLTLNPLGKVPVLELDDGERLVDSRAILDHLDERARPEDRLVQAAGSARRTVLNVDAIALGLSEKLYERGIEFARRAVDKRDDNVVQRVERQIRSALDWLEKREPSPWFFADGMTRADVTCAIAVTYMREKSRELVDPDRWPLLIAHCQRCEARSEFTRAAYSAAEASRSRWRSYRGQEPS